MNSTSDDPNIDVKKQMNYLRLFNLITSNVTLLSSLGDFVLHKFIPPSRDFIEKYDFIDSDFETDFHPIAQTLESYKIIGNDRYCIYPILCCEKKNTENYRGLSVDKLKMRHESLYIVPKHIAREKKYRSFVFPCYPKYDDKGNLIGFKELCSFIDLYDE